MADDANATKTADAPVAAQSAPAAKADAKDNAKAKGTVGLSDDRFTVNELNLHPVAPTATDALGVERIVGPALDNWEPAQVEPTEEAKAHMQEVADRQKAAREFRADALTGATAASDSNSTAEPAKQAIAAEHK